MFSVLISFVPEIPCPSVLPDTESILEERFSIFLRISLCSVSVSFFLQQTDFSVFSDISEKTSIRDAGNVLSPHACSFRFAYQTCGRVPSRFSFGCPLGHFEFGISKQLEKISLRILRISERIEDFKVLLSERMAEVLQ